MKRTKELKCGCECGESIKLGRKYILGHNRRGKTCSLEQREKISKNPYRQTDEYREKQRIAQTGRKHSEETKQKISEHNKGKTFSVETINKMSVSAKLRGIPQKALKTAWKATKDVPLSIKHREKLSIAAKDRYTMEKNPRWKGGISFLPYHYEFNQTLKNFIRNRDNFCCQLCGKSEKENKNNLSIHHINYDKLNVSPNQLISLCISCHGKTSSGDRGYWKMILNEKLKNNEKN